MIEEFKTLCDFINAFILRCKANDVIPCERHIEAYLSIIKAEKYNSILLKNLTDNSKYFKKINKNKLHRKKLVVAGWISYTY